MRRLTLCAVAACVCVACSGATGPEPDLLSGRWVGLSAEAILSQYTFVYLGRQGANPNTESPAYLYDGTLETSQNGILIEFQEFRAYHDPPMVYWNSTTVGELTSDTTMRVTSRSSDPLTLFREGS